jgi:hypothetical protein
MAADRALVPGALPFELCPPGTLALDEVDLRRIVVPSNDKRYSRLHVLQQVIDLLEGKLP